MWALRMFFKQNNFCCTTKSLYILLNFPLHTHIRHAPKQYRRPYETIVKSILKSILKRDYFSHAKQQDTNMLSIRGAHNVTT